MSVLTNTKRLKEIAEGVFGPDRVELNNAVIKASNFILVIHFPEIELRNSRNSKHTIRDLWVQFACSLQPDNAGHGYVMSMRPRGKRTTASLKELQTGFAHSHLPVQAALAEYHNFCLGQSSFASIVDNLKLNGSEEDWELMLLSLTNYVSWESLEGGPHINMTSIAYQGVSNRVTSVSMQDIEQEVFRLLPHLPKEVWEFSPGLTLIETHPALYEFFNTYSRIRKLTTSRTSAGITPQMVEQAQREHRARCEHHIFKGKEYPFMVFDETLANIQSGSNIIERQVYDRMISTLKTHSINKSKQFLYESVKELHGQQFREVSTF
jgi:hypothetical protein